MALNKEMLQGLFFRSSINLQILAGLFAELSFTLGQAPLCSPGLVVESQLHTGLMELPRTPTLT